MKLQLNSVFLLAILFFGLFYVGVAYSDIVQATDVSWILSTDTTWTKAGSPYTLVGNLLVSNGVTLTIQSGVTVNINGYLFMINGTIRALGTSAEPIIFNNGSVQFYSFSSGGVFDNTNFKNGSISSWVTLKVTNSFFDESLSAAGSSEITNNEINDRLNVGGSATTKNNQIKNGFEASGTCTVQNNVITGKVTIYGTSLFSSNTVTGSVNSKDSSIVTNNVINGDVSVNDNAEISHNTITGNISINGQSPLIAFNNVGNGITASTGSPKIENNSIKANDIGINLSPGGYAVINATILNNVIDAKNIGIDIKPSKNFGMTLPSWVTYALISGNTISNCATAGIRVGSGDSYAGGVTPYNDATIKNNFISNCYYAIDNDAHGAVEGNIIVNNVYGIYGGYPIRNNIVANNTYGISSYSTVEGNFIVNNQLGLDGGDHVRNNTVTQNNVGIRNSGHEIQYNNIFNNQLNFNLTSSNDANATNNWWGTTDIAAIHQKIHDYNDDFLLGRVNIEPVLTALNPSAPSPDTPIPEVPQNNVNPTPSSTPTPSSLSPASESPSSTPSPTEQSIIAEFSNPIVIVTAIVAVAVALMLTVKLQKKQN